MKIFLKKYNLLIIVVIIISGFIIGYLWHINSTSYEYIRKLDQIGTLLNHQDFEGASAIYKEIQSYSGDEIIQDLDYDHFIMRTGLVITMLEEDSPRRKRELIASRLQYFPSEKNNAKILSMIRDSGFDENCKGNEQAVVDSIEIGFCWLRNKKIDDSQKKLVVRDLIKNLYEKIIQRKNIQEMSDLGNLIGMYQYTTYRDPSLYEYKKTLGKSIITIDPHFVNGYILLISGNISTDENQKQVNQEIFDQMKKNYIGDKSQYDNYIPQYAKGFDLDDSPVRDGIKDFHQEKNDIDVPNYESIHNLHYQDDILVYVRSNNLDQIYRNGNSEGEKYDQINFLGKLESKGFKYFSGSYIQYTNSGKVQIFHQGKWTEQFDDIRNETENLDFPIFIGKKEGKEYYLSGIEIQGIGYDSIYWIKKSRNNEHTILSVVSNGENGIIHDGRYISGATVANFQNDGKGLLYIKSIGSDKRSLMRDNTTLFTWSGAGIIGSLKGGENVNALELGYLGKDGEGTGDDAFMQYIVNGIPHEKTKLFDGIHTPFFGENLFVYAYKKADQYYYNANNQIYGPYMSYPNIHVFGDEKRFIAIGQTYGSAVELIIDNEKIREPWDFGDVGFSPDKMHYAYTIDDKIIIDGIEKMQVFPGGEVGPVIDNAGNLISFIGYKDGKGNILFNNRTVHSFQLEPLIGYKKIMPILNNQHYILYGDNQISVDGVRIDGYDSENPHGIIECGDTVFALENIRPPDKGSQLLIWSPKQQFLLDNSYGPIFSEDCSKVAYIIVGDHNKISVKELQLK